MCLFRKTITDANWYAIVRTGMRAECFGSQGGNALGRRAEMLWVAGRKCFGSHIENAIGRVRVRTSAYQCVPIRTSAYQCVPMRTNTYECVPVRTSAYEC